MKKICILSFNHPEITSKALRSALTFLPAQDILLVHNGSLAQHQLKLQQEFSQIQHLILSKNLGFSGGANAGLKHLFDQGTEWILFLTNDCELIHMGTPPDSVCLSAPKIWRRKMGKLDSIGGKLNLEKAQLRHCFSEEDFFSQQDKGYIPGTAFWIHRDIFTASQGFNTELGTYWEDVDLSLRLGPEKLSLSPQTEIIHAVGKTCHKDIHYTTYLFQRNRKRVCLNHAQNSKQKFRIKTRLAQSWLQTGTELFIKRDFKKLAVLFKAIKS